MVMGVSKFLLLQKSCIILLHGNTFLNSEKAFAWTLRCHLIFLHYSEGMIVLSLGMTRRTEHVSLLQHHHHFDDVSIMHD